MIALSTPATAGPAAGAVLRVDLSAVADNTRMLASRTSAALMAVVKADGFGHGAASVAATALRNGATSLGVTSIAEALSLREAGFTDRILSWLNPPDADFTAACRGEVEVAVPSLAHLLGAASGARAAGRRVKAHLFVDCGMARDGAPRAEWMSLCRASRQLEVRGDVSVVGIMGHLPFADEADPARNSEGRRMFILAADQARAAGLRPTQLHLGATSVALTDEMSHLDMLRVGAGLVGIDPTGTTALRPAMALDAPLVQIREVSAGTGVGYGHVWRATAETRLGLVPLGYADGIPRHATNRAQVLVGGVRCPVVGRVSMDQTVIDLGRVPAVPGDRVTIFGPGDRGEPTVKEWAAWCGTIEHEIVTGIGPRVRRHTTPNSPRLVR